jgi:hypothetical protein
MHHNAFPNLFTTATYPIYSLAFKSLSHWTAELKISHVQLKREISKNEHFATQLLLAGTIRSLTSPLLLFPYLLDMPSFVISTVDLVALLLRVWESAGSSLGPETRHPD